ncbi:alpha/beta fold hydrolase [Paucibacter sp. XJ19-41]|uniref:alpha/beta fold hydrolase n=1 Tax=Paucibacter sp. XJ19-41 TaxID=2927824 RepID=UPI0023498897|nr:alpha/beta fold hydrolase [Paucibacter sp. XJ19-41]MDC6171036.1 alpha/beta fold hydrolase [Paucibacter sp. XJ19-41]
MKTDSPLPSELLLLLLQLQAGALRWRVQRAGSKAGLPRLLLLHGTGSSLQSWAPCLPGLAEHFSLLIPDLPGHGGSEGFADGQASPARMAQALGGLLAALDWQPELVAGHSAGAAVMVQMCLDGLLPQARGLLAALDWQPELVAGHSAGAAVMVQMCLDGLLPQARGLLAVNGALQPLPGLMGVVAPAVAKLAARSGAWLPAWVTRHAGQPRALKNLIASTGSRLDEAGVQHYRELLAQPAHVRGVLDMLASWRLEDLQARLPELRTPVWLAAGLADRTVAPVQSLELARWLPGASFHPLPGLGHLAHEEAPERVNALVMGLWDETRGRATTATSSVQP